MNGTDRLAQLIEVLEQIEALLPDGQTAWDDDPRTRLAIERLWITAGNLAEAHRVTTGVRQGSNRGRSCTGCAT